MLWVVALAAAVNQGPTYAHNLLHVKLVNTPAPKVHTKLRPSQQGGSAAEAPATAVSAAEVDDVTHETAALLLVTGLFGTPVLVLMAHSRGLLGKRTFALLDGCIMAIIALFIFNAFDQFLNVHSDFEAHHKVLIGVLHVCLLLFLCSAMLWVLRMKHYLPIFVAFASNYLCFSAMYASGLVQVHHFESQAMQPVFILVVFAGGVAVWGLDMLALRLLGWRSKDFEDEVNRLVVGLVQTVIAYATMHAVKAGIGGQVVHFSVAGKEKEVDVHTSAERLWMVAFSVAALGASLALPAPDATKQGPYGSRIVDVAKGALFMCCGWGLWLYADWEFYETLFPPATAHPLFAACAFAIAVSVICFTLVAVLGLMKLPDSALMQSLPLVLGSIVSMSVKEPFVMSADRVFPGMWGHILLSIATPLVLGPLWLRVVRPNL
jgi:hypothetical protein